MLRRKKLAKGRQIDAVMGAGSVAIKPCPAQLFAAPTKLAKGRQIDAVIGAGSAMIKPCRAQCLAAPTKLVKVDTDMP